MYTDKSIRKFSFWYAFENLLLERNKTEMIVITWKFGCLDYTLSSASDVA